MLSNTTCFTSCMTGYGQNTSDILICIQCEENCSSCTDHPKNCTACLVGFYKYFNGLDNLCVKDCVNGTFITGFVCALCDPTCGNCSIASTNCTSCSPGYYIYNNLCTNSCPINYFFDSTTWSCISCSTTNCFSGLSCPPDYFMNGNICVDTCPNYYLPSSRLCVP